MTVSTDIRVQPCYFQECSSPVTRVIEHPHHLRREGIALELTSLEFACENHSHESLMNQFIQIPEGDPRRARLISIPSTCSHSVEPTNEKCEQTAARILMLLDEKTDLVKQMTFLCKNHTQEMKEDLQRKTEPFCVKALSFL